MRLTIRTMLFGVVATLILIVCGQGAVGLYTLHLSNGDLVAFSEVRLPHANALGHIRDEFANLRLSEATLIVAKDDAAKAQAQENIDAAISNMGRYIATLAKLGTVEDAKELESFAQVFESYSEKHQRFRLMVYSQFFDIATDMYVKELGEIYAQGVSALSAMAVRGQSLAEEATLRAADDYKRTFYSVIGATAAALLFGVLAGLYVVRQISTPLLRMARAMKALSRGSYDADLPMVRRPYELSQMADSLSIFRDELRDAEAMRERQAERERETAALVKTERVRLADDFARVVDEVTGEFVELARQVTVAAGELHETAEGTSQKSETVSHSAAQASSNVQAIATAAEELAKSVQEIAKQANHSSTLTTAAAVRAKATETVMRDLSDQASKIEEVIGLISAIAGQTNLLALNATIEAARAGEAGRGFAIVASEVKGLAAQTTQATEEICARINEIQAATKQAVDGIYGIVSEVNSVREVSQSIAAAVEQQGAATGEIAASAADAAGGTGQVTDNITEVNLAATKTGDAAQMLLSLASTLQTRSRGLVEEVSHVIDKMKAA